MAHLNLAQMAVQSLLAEVSVTPKPGLVDPVSQGPHPDMDVFTFINSATSLVPYFETCETIGRNYKEAASPKLFAAIRPAGIQAEQTMFAATNGVNTHKGAIFALGILVTASAYAGDEAQTSEVIRVVQAMLTGLVAHDFAHLNEKDPARLTAGERQYLKYGKTGSRGEAEAGFPVVSTVSLPYLRQAQGTTNACLLDTLMMIALNSEDSNLIKRAGTAAILPWAHQQFQEYFNLGASQTTEGRHKMQQICQTFDQKKLSLGGSADLLIITIFLGKREGLLD
ncbi:triphosphoribosyl-dephospho-CoA synthase CitG [Levilactobacillus bambusae]|uniref:Probable 2-(5''-triphosphoribosyl)-3'-dephosphocoenzyme-A synthase n=1 Tax=Levilactobacillus bambusae TaxID=2024736 RepID=A0A2V1N1D4_9LACO|nr:triphosphoribosyl-dephospho-CoA synthase CitG [Levilactobacillus bambusae]PWG00833.1 triphosphoribosyl-dephospho-CoA synthase [Levilactobacillus bambusae]